MHFAYVKMGLPRAFM